MPSDVNGSTLEQALNLFEQDNSEQALEMMQQVLLDEPHNPNVRIEYANMLMRVKRFDDARNLLNSLSDEDKNNPAALSLTSQLEAINAVIDAPDLDTLIQTINTDPLNCLAREQLSAHYKLRGEYAAAMDQLIEIVRHDRSYKDDIGRTELLKYFEIIKDNSDLLSKYRKKLAQILN